jgi:cyanophycin synthetase
MGIDVRDLRGLDGPNIYHAQPAVKLQLWSDRDISRAVGDTIKRWANMTGLVIGYLDHQVEPDDGGYLITTTWTTPFPNVGERLAEGVVADVQAEEANDTTYSHDELLMEVIADLRREEPPLPLLQIMIEARSRDLPFMAREDGSVMVGSGSRGFVFDPSALGLGLTVAIPWDEVGRIPIIAVTGTNGKTTTTRLCAAIMAATGARVGRTDTDGIVIGGETVETGDWAGFGGARRVLTDTNVDAAVLETSRGGILRRGLGFDECDVAIITNISDDHLGEFGIDTLPQLARVKGVVAQAARPDGRAVLNADDPLLVALAPTLRAPVMWFSRHPDQPDFQRHLGDGGDLAWSNGTAIHVRYAGNDAAFPLDAIPIVNDGTALHNVENVLAATAACMALGVAPDVIADALSRFEAADNPGRLNIFRAHGATAVLDYAHNEAGVAALLAFGRQLRGSTNGKLIMLLGGPGDRPDAQIKGQGFLAGHVVDLLLLHEEERYLRGREIGETTGLYHAGATEAGLPEERIKTFSDELAALRYALDTVGPGDIILAAAHARRGRMLEALQAWSNGTNTSSASAQTQKPVQDRHSEVAAEESVADPEIDSSAAASE